MKTAIKIIVLFCIFCITVCLIQLGILDTVAASYLPPCGVLARAIAIDPQNPEIVYVLISRSIYRSIYKSIDSGGSWSPVSTEEFVGRGNDLRIDPENSQIIYNAVASLGDGIFKTADGGITWRHANKGLPEVRCDPRHFPDGW